MNRQATLDLIEILTPIVGADCVVARTAYRVQIFTKPNMIHNVWVSEDGTIKWKLFGRAKTGGARERLVLHLKRILPQNIAVAVMRQGAIDLRRRIFEASRDAERMGLSKGIFCDAGWRGSQMRISVVGIFGNSIESFSGPIEASSFREAEDQAVTAALSRYQDSDVTIFTDSEEAVQRFGRGRVQWINREMKTS